MDFSLFYFADDAAVDNDRYRLLLEGARFADTHGFRAVWTPERHFGPFGGAYPNPAVTGAALAAITEQVDIRAGSVVAPLHDAARIAEEWSVVDNLSGGRAGLAFASGWHVTDFALRPEAYRRRRELVADQLETVRRLWRGDEIDLVDGAGDPVRVRVFPPPVRPTLPMWLSSAGSPETFHAAARLGVGVLTGMIGHNLAQLEEKVADYRRRFAAEHDGRGHVVLMLHTFLGASAQSVREVVREPLRDYLCSSAAQMVRGADVLAGAELDAEDLDYLVDRAFDDYVANAGLFGTVEDGVRMLRRLVPVDVDEVACLIDFVPDADAVLEGLGHLDLLRRRWQDGAR
jgi:natural product biosynthesis luciferase-like monooxygenase protein